MKYPEKLDTRSGHCTIYTFHFFRVDLSSSSPYGPDLTFPTYPVDRENLDRHLTLRLRVTPARVVVGRRVLLQPKRRNVVKVANGRARARAREHTWRTELPPSPPPPSQPPPSSPPRLKFTSRIAADLISVDSPTPHPPKNRLVTLVTFRGHAWYPDHKFHWQLCNSRALSRPSATSLERVNARTCTHRLEAPFKITFHPWTSLMRKRSKLILAN